MKQVEPPETSTIIMYPAVREGNINRVYELLARAVKRTAQQTAASGVQSKQTERKAA